LGLYNSNGRAILGRLQTDAKRKEEVTEKKSDAGTFRRSINKQRRKEERGRISRNSWASKQGHSSRGSACRSGGDVLQRTVREASKFLFGETAVVYIAKVVKGDYSLTEEGRTKRARKSVEQGPGRGKKVHHIH